MSSCWKSTPQQVSIKLFPEQKFQKISGWTATAQAAEKFSPVFEKYKDKLFDDAVNNLGINRLNLEIKSGTENPKDWFSDFKANKITQAQLNERRYETINDNDDPLTINPDGFQFSDIDFTIENVVLPIKKRLEQRNEKLFVSLNVVDLDKDKGNSNFRLQDNSEEYVEFILAVFQHIQAKYGCALDAVELNDQTNRTATSIGQTIIAMAKRLNEHKFKPTFIVPFTKNESNASTYIDEISNVPDAMQYITEFSYRRYGENNEWMIQKVVEQATKYKKQTAMLEWTGANYEVLHKDLKIGKASAWKQNALAFNNVPDTGAQYYLIDDRNPDDPKISFGSRTKFFKQYFHFIRADAERIGADSSNPEFDPLAFINSNNKYVLVVKADTAGAVSVEGLPPGIYGISYTTRAESEIVLSDITLNQNEILKTNIPEKGVVTIFQK